MMLGIKNNVPLLVMLKGMGKVLIITGIIIIAVGVLLQFHDRLPFGRLPGDIRMERENFSFHFPLMSSILISILLSVILYLVNKARQ